METQKLTVLLTTEYAACIERIRAEEDLRKCRSWPELAGITGSAEIVLQSGGILLSGRADGKSVQVHCGYDSVISVTERCDGVLLRLSHKRLLFLPVSGNPQENEALMNGMYLLGDRCQCAFFRNGQLRLRGVSAAERFRFHTRKRKGISIRNSFAIGTVIVLTALFLFVGTVFVRQPFCNRKVDMQETISVNGLYIDLKPYYRRSALNDIDLNFRHEVYTIDGSCTDHSLLEALQQIPMGTKMSLLLHPISRSVLQIEAEGEQYLAFSAAQEKLWRESLFFGVLGVFMYAGSGYLIWLLVRKKI
jgi:hypothetical protein